MAETDTTTPREHGTADLEVLRERLSALALTETERLVLEARYGVGGNVLSYGEISRLFGMAPVLVRALERRVAASLQH